MEGRSMTSYGSTLMQYSHSLPRYRSRSSPRRRPAGRGSRWAHRVRWAGCSGLASERGSWEGGTPQTPSLAWKVKGVGIITQHSASTHSYSLLLDLDFLLRRLPARQPPLHPGCAGAVLPGSPHSLTRVGPLFIRWSGRFVFVLVHGTGALGGCSGRGEVTIDEQSLLCRSSLTVVPLVCCLLRRM